MDGNKNIITEQKLNELSELVRSWLTPKRYEHTAFVVKAAGEIGEKFLPDRVNELKAAAWLHDITKRDGVEAQLAYFEKYGVKLRKDEKNSPRIFHSISGAYVAKENFWEYVNEDIISGVRWHTTGRDGMTVFEAIVYLADYIEDSRTFDDCVSVRKMYHEKLSEDDESLRVLAQTMVYSFDLTIKGLLEQGETVDIDTVEARNYFIDVLNGTSKLS